MALSKLFLLSIFLALICSFTQVTADASVTEDEPLLVRSDASDSSALKIELEQLNSRIYTLESHVNEKIQELKAKDEKIVDNERIIKEKSESIASLHNEIASLEQKGSLDAKYEAVKTYARVGELEKQVEQLETEIETRNKEKLALEAWTNEAKNKLTQLNAEHEKIKKVIAEQKTKIRKTERALKVAEAHGSWLPRWLAVHYRTCQSVAETHWNEHGKPAVNLLTQKVLEKKDQAQKLAEPHFQRIKTEFVPVAKEKWVLVTSVEPHVQSLKTKSIEYYEASKLAATPHIVKVTEFVDPHFQEAKKFTKPYIDQVATAVKPHIDKTRAALKPYTKQAVQAYGKFLETASRYHHQVKETAEESLKQLELTKHLATKEFVWFAEFLPVAKEKWVLVTSVEPHVQSLKTKSIEYYEASKLAATPHIVKVTEFVDPHFQEAKKFTKLYIDQVASAVKPHVDKTRAALKPYTKQAVQAYGKFLETAYTYHHQVKETAEESLKQLELTKHLATKEFVWFAEFLPVAKEKWVLLVTSVEPHVQSLKTKSIEYYEASKLAATPHIVKVTEFVDPHFQEAKKFTKPYIDQVATAVRPHVDKTRAALKPSTQQAVQAYGKFLEIASTYHHQVKETAEESLKQHELTKHLATNEFVWFAEFLPVAKEKWVLLVTYVEPHVQSLKTKSIEYYEASKLAATPHIVKVTEFVDPHFQEAKKFTKPYIDQVATAVRPHVDKTRAALKPYTQQAVQAYGKFLETASTYHHQVKETVEESLKQHELTKPLATKEFVWFAASALLALPIIFLFRILSSIFGSKKTRKPNQHKQTHARGKGKRVHSEI